MSIYGAISGLYFPVFRSNTVKYGPEIAPCLDTFYTVLYRGIIPNVKQMNEVKAMNWAIYNTA